MTAVGQTPANTDLTALALGAAEAFKAIGGGGNPAFGSPWSNLGGVFATAAFRRLTNELVAMRGVVTGGHNDETIFTLPAGYRPAERRSIPTIVHDGSGLNYSPAILTITTAGVVSVHATALSTFGGCLLDCVFVA